MEQTKDYGPLGACKGIPPARTTKILDKVRKEGYDLKKPVNGIIPRGAAICVPIWYYGGVYFHHGVAIDEENIIDYSGAPITIGKDSYSSFSYGVPDNIRITIVPRNPMHADKVIARAHSRLGEDEYNFFTNNCESFAMWCMYGEQYTHQVNNWLTYIAKRMNVFS